MAKAKGQFRQTIAKRQLGVENTKRKVTVEIAKPVKREADYACPYRIKFGNEAIHFEIYGIDAFQALQLTLKTIPVELRYNKRLPIGRMYQFEPGDDMGFPEEDLRP